MTLKFELCDIRTFSSEAYEAAVAELDADKLARLERTRQRKDRLRTVAADATVRRMLSECLGVPTAQHDLYCDENGKPHLRGDVLYFSISHSEDMVAVAVDERPVGIDIEKIRDVPLRPAKKYFSAEERMYLFGRAPKDVDFEAPMSPDVLLRFFEIWTAKEAYLKSTGEGLSRMRSVDTSDKCFERHLLPEDYLLTVYTEE